MRRPNSAPDRGQILPFAIGMLLIVTTFVAGESLIFLARFEATRQAQSEVESSDVVKAAIAYVNDAVAAEYDPLKALGGYKTKWHRINGRDKCAENQNAALGDEQKINGTAPLYALDTACWRVVGDKETEEETRTKAKRKILTVTVQIKAGCEIGENITQITACDTSDVVILRYLKRSFLQYMLHHDTFSLSNRWGIGTIDVPFHHSDKINGPLHTNEFTIPICGDSNLTEDTKNLQGTQTQEQADNAMRIRGIFTNLVGQNNSKEYGIIETGGDPGNDPNGAYLDVCNNKVLIDSSQLYSSSNYNEDKILPFNSGQLLVYSESGTSPSCSHDPNDPNYDSNNPDANIGNTDWLKEAEKAAEGGGKWVNWVDSNGKTDHVLDLTRGAGIDEFDSTTNYTSPKYLSLPSGKTIVWSPGDLKVLANTVNTQFHQTTINHPGGNGMDWTNMEQYGGLDEAHTGKHTQTTGDKYVREISDNQHKVTESISLIAKGDIIILSSDNWKEDGTPSKDPDRHPDIRREHTFTSWKEDTDPDPAIDNSVIISSLSVVDETATGKPQKVLGLIAGCDVRIDFEAEPGGYQEANCERDKLCDFMGVELNNVAILAPAGGIKVEKWDQSPKTAGKVPTVYLKGSIATKHRGLFGQYETNDAGRKLATGYQKDFSYAEDFVNAETAWWPNMKQDNWVPLAGG